MNSQHQIIMKAVQWNKTESALRLINTDIPIISEESVLLKISHAGVCGSDVHIIQKDIEIPVDQLILGHEIAGTVVKVGSAVGTIHVGQRVIVDMNPFCGVCSFCQRGKRNHCPECILKAVGISKDGGYAEFCSIPARQAIPLPESMPMEHAVLCEPLSCVVHGFDLISPVPAGSKILIMGAGIFGLLWASLFHFRGFRDVTITEIADGRRELVRESGLGFEVVQPSTLQDQITDKCLNSNGFDIVVDCTGDPSAIEMAFNLLNHCAKLCMFGLMSAETEVRLRPSDITHKELMIIGTVFGPFCLTKSVKLVSEMADRYLDYAKLGIEIFPLEKYELAFSKLKTREICKAVFKYD